MAGNMTYTEYQDNLFYELGNNDLSDGYRGDWVNRAYRTLCTQNEFFGKKVTLYFPELETSTTDSTANGTATVSVPSDCHFIRTIWESSSDRKMINISWRDYVDMTGRADSGSRSAPTMWTRRGSNVHFYPTPDAAYGLTIYYKKHITEMTAGVDTTEIGEEWDESVLKLAVVQSMFRLKMYEQAEIEKGIFSEIVAGAASAYDHEAEDRESKRFPDRTWINNDYR